MKSNSRQGKHGEFENFGKTQGKHSEFENFRMILKSNSHLHSRAAGRGGGVEWDGQMGWLILQLTLAIYEVSFFC